MRIEEGQKITFEYTNWNGNIGTRTVVIKDYWYTRNEWHPEEQWILHCYDYDKQAMRMFAMKDMRNIRKVEWNKKYLP